MLTPLFLLLSHLAHHPSAVQYRPVSFENLPRWESDDHRVALEAFRKSCPVLMKPHKSPAAIGNQYLPLSEYHWRHVCIAAMNTRKFNEAEAKAFFEHWFLPVELKSRHHRSGGIFTGYYTPFIHGSLTPHGPYQVPLYAKPYWRRLPRAVINRGALDGRAEVLAWTISKVDRFFLQIQGSGIVILDNGNWVRLGYAGKNGAPYTSISRILMHHGYLTARQLSLANVKRWLYRHPYLGEKMMDLNASFVYFHKQKRKEIVGQFNVPITAKRTLAVDHRYVPYGVPIWLDTHIPPAKHHKQARHFSQLMIAQDTGAAIKGVVRGDIYMGLGRDAKRMAMMMNYPGRYWLLLPRRYPHFS